MGPRGDHRGVLAGRGVVAGALQAKMPALRFNPPDASQVVGAVAMAFRKCFARARAPRLS